MRIQYVPASGWLLALLLSGCTHLPSKDELLDPDADGSLWGDDCDNTSAAINPGAAEVCGDGVVNDCLGNTASAMAGCGLGGTLSLSRADLKLVGEASANFAGCSVSQAGDLDGDGFDDLLVGASGEYSGGGDAGAAYLVLGGPALLGSGATLSLSSADVKLTGEDANNFAGLSVSGAGDVNRDGFDDLLVGAYQESTGGSYAGAAYLVLGGPELLGSGATRSLSSADVKLTGEAVSDQAGRAVSGAGDVDGDGFDDLLVGAEYDDSGGESAGAAYLVIGGPARLGSRSLLSLSSADVKFTGEAIGDQAGRAVSGAGDVDGDGFDDLLVGAYHESTGGENAGAAYLVLGGPALLGSRSPLSLSSADVKLTGEAANNYAGLSVSQAGDVDGDGFDDMMIGAYYAGGWRAGAAYLVLGGPALLGSGSLLSLSSADVKLIGEAAEDHAGWSVSGAGDVDGDGFDDLLVGAYQEDNGGVSAGATYLVLGGGY